jgi:hypothetical protein
MMKCVLFIALMSLATAVNVAAPDCDKSDEDCAGMIPLFERAAARSSARAARRSAAHTTATAAIATAATQAAVVGNQIANAGTAAVTKATTVAAAAAPPPPPPAAAAAAAGAATGTDGCSCEDNTGVVGRPLTPLSAAGVARRNSLRRLDGSPCDCSSVMENSGTATDDEETALDYEDEGSKSSTLFSNKIALRSFICRF